MADPNAHLAHEHSPSLHASYSHSLTNSTTRLPADGMQEKSASDALISSIPPSPSGKQKRRPLMIVLISLLVIIVVVLAVVLPVYFAVVKPRKSNEATASTQPSKEDQDGKTDGNNKKPVLAITGGDGSLVTSEDGSQFTYSNTFGGYWYHDPQDPYNNYARPNSWTPPLNETWTWGKDRINGVNLGGLFVLEPFISPALYQKYPGATDEWSLSTLMAADTAGGGLKQLEDHYDTFITEQDIAEIAGAGLNWVRVPIPFWAVDTWPGEPFLAKKSWKYIVRLFEWCRKYGIRVNLDLHSMPGSQNGYNHSGKFGKVNFMNGNMGYANAQRGLNYIRVITEFISQLEYSNLVVYFGIMNEPLLPVIGKDNLRSFYTKVYRDIRDITGIGAGKGPVIGFHDGFTGLQEWNDFLRGADRIAMDWHPYLAFGGTPALDPIDTGTGTEAGGVWPRTACERWAQMTNDSRTGFGPTVAGEWSSGYNDCGLFLTGVGIKTSFGGDCGIWQDSSKWSPAVKDGLMMFAKASMDALGDWFYWTWKIGNSTAGHVESPLWSYQLGLKDGWIPKDPRSSVGTCQALGVNSPAFSGVYESWQVGAATDATVQFQYPWPPANIANAGGAAIDAMPQYTSTAAVVTLQPPTATAAQGPSMTGWTNPSDTGLAPAPEDGCKYLDNWDALDGEMPPPCKGNTVAK